MFCPSCGDLAYPSNDGSINCQKTSCLYSGIATIPSVIVRAKKYCFERTAAANDAWDEPRPRLQSTVTKFCQKCGSNNLKIVGSDLECIECGADVS